ncbi:chromosome condensation complex Condensin, subunit G [Naganishia albida]|nr:chromosome condensation complex Condensin, subunit G [Naganishia albida]
MAPAGRKKTNKQEVEPSTLDDLDPIISIIPTIFSQAQSSISNHKKNIVALRKIQEKCSLVTDDKTGKLVGEKVFNNAFIDMVNRVLSVKKGVSVADRVVQFVGKFVAYTVDQDTNKEAQNDEDEDAEESFSGRFANKLLKHLLAGCQAKDKNVRYRVVQLVVVMINGLGELDDDLYVLLRSTLLDRARDKETPVRIQAALGLAKLRGAEDPEDLEEDEENLDEVLLDLLRFDSAPEVRRAALYNLSRTPATVPHILARTRDSDATLRRIVYLGPLSTQALPDPRVLSIAQREEVVKNGLGDREPAVRRAAAFMLGEWLTAAGGDLLEFLRRFDVVSSQVAEDALLSLFVTRKEIVEGIAFDADYWTVLTPEKAFLARVFVEHCISKNDDARLERVLPVVTAMAFKLQEEYNLLEELTPADEIDQDEPLPVEYVERTFVVAELCKMAVNLDYSDEIGRRKMFQLAREMISQRTLPETIIPLCLDVLYKISDSERDLIRVIVDVVTELRVGPGDDREPDETMSVAGSVRYQRRNSVATTASDNAQDPYMAALVDSRCLSICISLLERVNGTLQENSVFHGLLPDLIIPAVKNKYEPFLRDQGLICLGLCSMIDSNMAKNSIGLFMQQIGQAEGDLQVKVAKIVFDLFMVHDPFNLLTGIMPSERIVEFMAHMLQQDAPAVHAVACEGLAKLMLSGMLYDKTLLQNLIILYLSPETSTNLPLRQCLSYFFPVYCYSSVVNQQRMRSISVETMELLAEENEEAGSDTYIPLSQVTLLLIDWTDPEKIADNDGAGPDTEVHLDLAIEIIRTIYRHPNKDHRKLLASMLGKLRLPDTPTKHKIQGLALLLRYLVKNHPMGDVTSRNAVTRFENSLKKKYGELLEEMDDEAARLNSELKDVWEFIDDSDGEENGKSRVTKSRAASSTPQPQRRSKRISALDESDEDLTASEAESAIVSNAMGEVDEDARSVDSMLDGGDDEEDSDDE